MTDPQLFLEADFSTFRSLNLLVADNKIIYVNAFYPTKNFEPHYARCHRSDALYSTHPKSEGQNDVEESRDLVRRYINAESSSVAFTRNTPEARGCFICSLKFEPGENVIVWTSNIQTMLRVGGAAQGRPRVQTSANYPRGGGLSLPPTRQRLLRTLMTIPEQSVSSIMFHSGQWNDVADTCKTSRPRGIHVFADLTQ